MKIYLVGGAVRDSLLNLPIKDKDWVVVGATVDILLKYNFQPVGKEFPVFLHPVSHEEYALARTEHKSGLGYHGFVTNFSPDVTLEDDLMRRDLTINAIAKNVEGEFIDPCSGKSDLKNRILRHISPSFSEDPLRVLRVARFAATFTHLGFVIATETMLLMKSIVDTKELLFLKLDRVWKETKKALLTKNPHVYFQVLYDCNALMMLFPEINRLFNISFMNFSLNNFKNKKLCLWQYLAYVSTKTIDIDIRFSCIFQFLEINHKIIYFLGNNKILDKHYCFNLLFSFCSRFNISTDLKELIFLITRHYNFIKNIMKANTRDIILFLGTIDAWRRPGRIKKLVLLANLMHNFKFGDQSRYITPGDYLIISYYSSLCISSRFIVNLGFKGKMIKNQLIRLRCLKLDIWRKNFDLINNIY